VEKLLRIEDVSEMLGVPVLTLRDWRAKSYGPRAAKLGQRLVYRQSDVEAWVDAQFAAADEAS
jgi:predicted DNA-binding transcriptional regulator AlpA